MSFLWTTWWAVPILLLLLTGLSFFVYARNRAKRVREIEELRSRIADDLHDEIGSSLGNIALIADRISEKFTPDESSFVRLQEMSTDARQMSDAVRDIIWFVDTKKSSTVDLKGRLREIARSTLPGTINASFTADERTSNVALTMVQKRNLVLMFKEILYNVVQHARPSKVEIRFQENAGILEIQVADDGAGFEEANIKRGKGLVNMHRRADEMGGTCSIRSKPGQGTSVTISIPLGQGSSIPRMRDRL